MSPTILALADAHLSWLRLRRSPATVNYYDAAYKRLRAFLQDRQEQRANQWNPLVADTYAAWLLNQKMKPITARHYLDCLMSLFSWCVEQDYLKKHPLPKYERPSGKPAVITGFTHEEIERMIAACPNTKTGRRNLALVVLLYDTGLRSAEAAALTLADVDLTSHSLIVRHGKGDRSRVVTFSDATASVVRRWLLKDHPDGENASAPLFTASGKEPLTKWGLQRMVRRLAQRVGIDKPRLGPHLLRHSCGEQHIINGASTRVVMALMGHSSLHVAERYQTVAATDLHRMREQISPAGKLKGIR